MALRASATAAAMALAGLGCGGSGSEPPRASVPDRMEPVVIAPAAADAVGTLDIAAVFPTLGRYAVSGQQSLRGARLAVEELNRAGGVHGRRLRLAEYRTGSYVVDARHAAALAASDGVLAIVGANSSELSRAIAEVAESVGVPQLTNVSTASDITWDPQTGADRPFVFRMCATDDVMGRLLAGYARDTLGARRAAVLYEVGRKYSQQLARSFGLSFADSGAGREIAEFFYRALETDFIPQLRRVREYGPDVVFLPGSYTDATLVAAQARTVGLTATLLGGDAWSSPLLFQRGAPPGPAYYLELCQRSAEFERRFGETGEDEPPGCRAILAYDAVQVIAAGLRSLGPLEPAARDTERKGVRGRLREAIARTDLAAATGRVRFDARGDRRLGVALYAVEDTPEGPRARERGWLGER
ncbi:MAG TPA: ABC transporter substrate-binding protein [Vicinamibacteria bacterium]